MKFAPAAVILAIATAVTADSCNRGGVYCGSSLLRKGLFNTRLLTDVGLRIWRVFRELSWAYYWNFERCWCFHRRKTYSEQQVWLSQRWWHCVSSVLQPWVWWDGLWGPWLLPLNGTESLNHLWIAIMTIKMVQYFLHYIWRLGEKCKVPTRSLSCQQRSFVPNQKSSKPGPKASMMWIHV